MSATITLTSKCVQILYTAEHHRNRACFTLETLAIQICAAQSVLDHDPHDAPLAEVTLLLDLLQRQMHNDMWDQILLSAAIPTLICGGLGLAVGVTVGSFKGLLNALQLGHTACSGILHLSRWALGAALTQHGIHVARSVHLPALP